MQTPSHWRKVQRRLFFAYAILTLLGFLLAQGIIWAYRDPETVLDAQGMVSLKAPPAWLSNVPKTLLVLGAVCGLVAVTIWICRLVKRIVLLPPSEDGDVAGR